MEQFHNATALAHEDIHVAIRRVQPHSAHLTAHPIHPDTHVAWMLRHDNAIVFIQIKHGVFGCKVHNQKRHLKVGLFRMVTPQLPLSGGGYRRDRCYGGVAGFCKIKHPLCRWACGCCMGGGFGRVPNPRLLQLFEDLVNEFSYVAHIDGAVAVDVAIFVVFGGENHVYQSSYVAHIHDAIAVHVAEQRGFIFCF